jgi:hypothetical protein
VNKYALGTVLGSALLALSKKIGTKNKRFNQDFWKWFGKSVAVNSNGDPLEVYHGSPLSGFTEFEQDKEDKGHPSLFFTDSWKAAVGYAGTNDDANVGVFENFEDFISSIEEYGFKVRERWGYYYLKTENRFGEPLRGDPVIDVFFHYTLNDKDDVIEELMRKFEEVKAWIEEEDFTPQEFQKIISSQYPDFKDIKDLVFHSIEVYSEDDLLNPVFVWDTEEEEPSIEDINDFDFRTKPGVYSVYLSMQNPLILDFIDLENPPNWNNIPIPELGMVQVQAPAGATDEMGIWLFYNYFSSDGRKLKTKTTNEIVRWAYLSGNYDGVIFLGINDAAGGTRTFGHNINVFVPFYPTQIKSIENIGSWRPDINNISLNRR